MATTTFKDSVVGNEILLKPKTEPIATQLVGIPRKIYDQINEDSSPLQDTLRAIQMASGVVIKTLERDAARISTSHHLATTKARKEYFIQLTGSQNQIDKANDEINRTLKNNNPGERVSLKMDVSFSDHSFIIGRYGKGIQNVMHETQCHIHFPDSNRNSQYEKSNQVSISGPPDGVLEARRQIRNLLPISFAFVITGQHYTSAMTQNGSQIEPRPQVQEMINKLQNEHRITINMLPMMTFQALAALVTVRGRHANITRIKEGILKLMNFLVRDNAPLTVHVGIEVSPHHLDFVTGPQWVKLTDLMHETNTTIEIPGIPDRRQPIPTVRIAGHVSCVYEAWVKLMDLLPLALLVDIPESVAPSHGALGLSDAVWSTASDDLSFTDLSGSHSTSSSSFGTYRIEDVTVALNEMLENYDITLLSRKKNREDRNWWLVIKGPEKYVDLMFEIYKSLAQNDPVKHVAFYLDRLPPPKTYNIQQASSLAPSLEPNRGSAFEAEPCWTSPSSGTSSRSSWMNSLSSSGVNSSPYSITSTPLRSSGIARMGSPGIAPARTPFTSPFGNYDIPSRVRPNIDLSTPHNFNDSLRFPEYSETDSVLASSISGYASFLDSPPKNQRFSFVRQPSTRDEPCVGFSNLSLSDMNDCASVRGRDSFSKPDYGFGSSLSPLSANTGFPRRPSSNSPFATGYPNDLASADDQFATVRPKLRSFHNELGQYGNLNASNSGGLLDANDSLVVNPRNTFLESLRAAIDDNEPMSRYNLWGNREPSKAFDAAPGSGRGDAH